MCMEKISNISGSNDDNKTMQNSGTFSSLVQKGLGAPHQVLKKSGLFDHHGTSDSEDTRNEAEPWIGAKPIANHDHTSTYDVQFSPKFQRKRPFATRPYHEHPQNIRTILFKVKTEKESWFRVELPYFLGSTSDTPKCIRIVATETVYMLIIEISKLPMVVLIAAM